MNGLKGKIWRRVASLPADISLGLTNVAPISSYLGQRKSAIEERYVSPGSLSPNEAAVVNGLRQDGVFVTSLENLGLEEADNVPILDSGASIIEVLSSRVAAPNQQHPAAIRNTPDDLLANPQIYRWGLHATLLRIVETYLRQPVAYDGPIVFYTEANKAEAGTRLWHLDQEDRSVVKVALYLSHVDESGGPFQLLPQMPQNGNGRFKYPVVTTVTLERLLGLQANSIRPMTCTGKRGTLVFAETGSFYHRGAPPVEHDRSAIFYGYFGRPPRNPFYCERARLSRAQIVRLIDGLLPEQRASALWRDVVPWPIRLIPASKR